MKIVSIVRRCAPAAWLAIAAASMPNSAQAATVEGEWHQGASDTSCSVYFNSDTAFLVLSANADGSSTFRAHHEDWRLPDDALIAMRIDSGGESYNFPGSKALTSNGWDGAIANLETPPVEQLSATNAIVVTVDGSPSGEILVQGFGEQRAAFDACRDAMPKIDPALFPVTSPSPISNFGDILSGSNPPMKEFVFRLSVDAAGNTTRCEVLQSSGSEKADGALCKRLSKTRFKPARDRAGEPVAATFQTRISAAR